MKLSPVPGALCLPLFATLLVLGGCATQPSESVTPLTPYVGADPAASPAKPAPTGTDAHRAVPDNIKELSAQFKADFDFSHIAEPKTSHDYNQRGIFKLLHKDDAGALADYLHALELDPTNQDARWNCITTRYRLKDYAGSIADCDVLLAVKPDDPRLYHNRARARGKSGDWTGALADDLQTLKLNPTNQDALWGCITARYHVQDYLGSIADCNALLSVSPHASRVYYRRALARSRSGDQPGALVDYNTVLQLDPSDAFAHEDRASLLWAMDDDPAALADYEKAIQLKYPNEYAYFFRHLVLRRLNPTVKDDLATLAPTWKPGWPQSIGLYLTGQLSEEKFIAAAQLAPDAETRRGQLCEQCFYAGMIALSENRTADAREKFTACLATGVTGFTEYYLAQTELARLSAASSVSKSSAK